MSQVLRQSTQVIVRIGPAVAVGDGFTPVTTLTLSGADEAELLKANTTTTTDISGATIAAITGCDGWYGVTLTTSHTDTVGCLDIMVNDDSLILPIFARFQVIEEAAYDAIYAASADPKADVNVASIDANAITATAIASDAFTAAKFAADVTTEFRSVASGTSDSGSTTTMVDAARTEADTDYWKGCYILFTSGTIAGQCRLITGFNAGTDTITFSPATTQTVGTQTYEILPNGTVDVLQWLGTTVATPATAGIPDINVKNIDNDAASASGTVTFPNATLASTTNITAGTITTATNVTTVNGLAANVITAASMAADASGEIADAVWDEGATGHQTQGSFGQVLGDSGSTAVTIWDRVTTALPNAATGAANGILRAGTNTATTFAGLTSTAGVTVTQSAGNSPGIVVAGNGSGQGISVTGGATGSGISVSGATGIEVEGTAGHSIYVINSYNGGHGLHIKVSGANSDAVNLAAYGTNGGAFYASSAKGIGVGIDGPQAVLVSHSSYADAVLIDSNGRGIVVYGDYDAVTFDSSSANGIVVTGSTGDIVGDITGSLSGTIGGLTAGAAADFFTVDSGVTFGDAVAGSVVKEIVDNAGGGSAPTAAEIADAVWDEDATGHQTQGSFGQAIGDPVADTNTIFKAVVTDAAGATVGADTTAVKTKTDSLTFTAANKVDANIKAVNDTTVTGAGTAGDPWGP